jgi:hypothetical protein
MKFPSGTGPQSLACSGEEADSSVMALICRCLHINLLPVLIRRLRDLEPSQDVTQ